MLNHKNIKYFKMAVNATAYKESDLDIACKCPICGDSNKKANSKRLHLYKKGDLELVNCFNAGCPVENKTMYSFLRDFYPHLLTAYKKETFSDKIENLKQNCTLGDLLEKTVQKDDIYPALYDLNEYFEELSSEYIDYLSNRKITPHFGGTWYKGKQDVTIQDIRYNIKDKLIIPLYCNNKVYGFYSRSITKKDFITFISTPGYKVWNWYNIDRHKPCYIFEGIFDGISTGLRNIIANLGAKIPSARLKELNDPIFCLDNDKTGISMSIEYAKSGYKVYIQPDMYKEKDFNELKLNHPDLDIASLISNNIYSGLSAITRLKLKLK